MIDDKSKDLDRQLGEKLRPLQGRRVPREMLKGFSAAVEKKILDGDKPLFPLTAVVPLLPVIFILMMLGALWFFAKAPLKIPEKTALSVPAVVQIGETISARKEIGAEEIPEAIRAMNDQDLVLEIEVLHALGVWTDEDDEIMGITLEDHLSVLELVLESETLPSASQPVL